MDDSFPRPESFIKTLDSKKYFHKCFFDNVLDGWQKIQKERTPSHWDGSGIEFKEITILNMRQWWGSSVGVDDLKVLYIERIPLEEIRDSRGVLLVKDWMGEDVAINLDHLVTARNGYSIATAKLISSNPNYPRGTYYYHFLVTDDCELELMQ